MENFFETAYLCRLAVEKIEAGKKLLPHEEKQIKQCLEGVEIPDINRYTPEYYLAAMKDIGRMQELMEFPSLDNAADLWLIRKLNQKARAILSPEEETECLLDELERIADFEQLPEVIEKMADGMTDFSYILKVLKSN